MISPRSSKRFHPKPYWREWPTGSGGTDDAQLLSVLGSSIHPELEDLSVLSWGLGESEKEKGPHARLDVLTCIGTDVDWQYEVPDDELETLVATTSPPDSIKERKLQVFFITTPWSEETDQSWLPGNFSISPFVLRILLHQGLSRAILAEIFSAEGWFAKMGPRCFTHPGESACLSSFEVSYRSRGGWVTGVGFTQFIRTRHQTTYFCINYPPHALTRLETLLEHDPSLAHRDFFLDALAADQNSKQWQYLIAQHRKELMFHENMYEDDKSYLVLAPKQLHQLSRNWNVLYQDCLDQLAVLEFLHRTYEKFRKTVEDPKNSWDVDKRSEMSESFEALTAQCDNLSRWTSVYRERTLIRINLLFHLTNQRESRTNTQIAASTAKVAEQTQRDSASMITMASLTMLFLPGTFISAVLSTTFFNFDEDGLHVSPKWWILPASTIPLTVVIFCLWNTWRRGRVKQLEEQAKMLQEERARMQNGKEKQLS